MSQDHPIGQLKKVLDRFFDQLLLPIRNTIPTLRIGIPDKLVDHATPQQSKESLGLTPEMMADQIRNKFNF